MLQSPFSSAETYESSIGDLADFSLTPQTIDITPSQGMLEDERRAVVLYDNDIESRQTSGEDSDVVRPHSIFTQSVDPSIFLLEGSSCEQYSQQHSCSGYMRYDLGMSAISLYDRPLSNNADI